MALLTETRDVLIDIQKTNYEILLELGKLEEKQQRRRELLLRSRTHADTSTAKKASAKDEKGETTPENHVEATVYHVEATLNHVEATHVETTENHVESKDSSKSKQSGDGEVKTIPDATTVSQTKPVNQPALTPEMMSYLCLLRRKKALEHQDNRLCEKFGTQPFKGKITPHRAPATTVPPKKVQHVSLPEKARVEGRQTQETRPVLKATRRERQKSSQPQTTRTSGNAHSAASQRSTGTGEDKGVVKAKHRASQRTHDERALAKTKPPASQSDAGALATMFSPEQVMQFAGGWSMAFNPDTGMMKAVSQEDIPELKEQSEAVGQPIMILTFDPRDFSLKLACGREMLKEVIDAVSEEDLAEMGRKERDLFAANRRIMQMFAENDVIPYAAFMQVIAEVIQTEGMQEQLESSMAPTMAAMQDPSQCHQIPVPGLTHTPAIEMPGGEETRSQQTKTRQRALPPADGSQPSNVPHSTSKSHHSKDKKSSKHTKPKPSSGLTSSPNVMPQREGSQTSQSRDSQGARSSGAEVQGGRDKPQQPVAGAYTRAGPALQHGSPSIASVSPASGTTAEARQPANLEAAATEDEGSIVYIDDSTWQQMANQQVEQGARARSIRERGMDTIICLDLSESMKGGPWKQAMTFIQGFIEGIQNTTLMDDVYEHVGLVTFGSETKVQQHMTCDYVEVLRKLAKLTPGGPSPLWAGITMIYAALTGAGSVFNCNGYKINPRVFLLTDGRLTPSNMIAGPDRCSKQQQDLEKFKVKESVARIHKEVPITLNVVPLGDFDFVLLEQLTKLTGGKMVSPDDWDLHTRTFRNYHAASKVGPMMKLADPGLVHLLLTSVGGATSTQDRLEMEEFLKTHKQEGGEDSTSDSEELPDLPSLGSRVKRNMLVYPDHAVTKVGTVTKHMKDGHIGVTWDEPDAEGDQREKIMYTGGFEGVLPCDVPRVLKDELIATGCRVRRGKDWRYADQDGGSGNLGSVFAVDSQGIVQVRWDNGRKNSYRFGQDGVFFDVEIVEVQSKVKKMPEKEKDPVDLIEEMNRKNIAASGNIMDNVPPSAAQSQARAVSRDNVSRENEMNNSRNTDQRSVESVNKVGSVVDNRPAVLDPGDETDHKTGTTGSSVSEAGADKGARPKAVLSPEEIKWCWNNNNCWEGYPPEICSKIETSFRRNPRGTSLIKVGDKQFRIRFSRMDQVDVDTKEKYPVCRK